MPVLLNKNIKCNPWARELEDANERYVVLHSGRNAGKDYAICQVVAKRMLGARAIRVMFCRQFQSSIAQSIKALLEQVISDMDLDEYFKIGRNEIRSKNGSVAHFKGADRNPQNIKGWQGYDILVLNECQTISSEVWEIIKPTMRENNSQIYCILNPRYPTDAIASELLGPNLKGFDDPDVRIIGLSYEDNKFLSDVAKLEIAKAKKGDPVLFEHIWGGGYDIGALANPFSRKGILDARRDVKPGVPYWTSVDLAVTENKGSDFTVAIKSDKNGNLIDFVQDKFDNYDVQIGRIMSFAGNTRMLVDATGVGKTVAKMIRDNHSRVNLINWTSTEKLRMIGSLSGVLDAGMLSIPTDKRWDWLQEELLHYERKSTSTGQPTRQYAAAENFHDDGVASLMMLSQQLIKPRPDWTKQVLI